MEYCRCLQLIIDFYNETYTTRDGVQMSEDTLMMLWSLTTALFLPGGLIGSLLGGWLADAIGRQANTAFTGAKISTRIIIFDCVFSYLFIVG